MAAEQRAQQTTDVDDETADVALSLFEHIENQINRTDTKAQVVLAADAILLGWFSAQNPSAVPAMLASHASAGGRLTAGLMTLVFVGLILSLACGLVVIWPRSGVSASERSSLVYFGGIARRNESDFVATFLRQSRVEVTANVLAGVHAKARIATQKFRWVGLSVAFLLATVVLWTALELTSIALR